MVKISESKLIIEFDDVCGLEADTLQRIYVELHELLHCALILQHEYARPVESAYYGIFSLLKALAPTLQQLDNEYYDIPSECR